MVGSASSTIKVVDVDALLTTKKTPSTARTFLTAVLREEGYKLVLPSAREVPFLF